MTELERLQKNIDNNYLNLNEEEDKDDEEDIHKNQNMETPRKNRRRGRKKIEQKYTPKKQLITLKKAKSIEKAKTLDENKDENDNNKKTFQLKRSKSIIKNSISNVKEKEVIDDNDLIQNKEENNYQNNKNDGNSDNSIQRKNTISNKSKDEKNNVRKEIIISSKSTGIEDYDKKESQPFDLNDKNSFRVTPYKPNKDLKRQDTLDEIEKQNRRNEFRHFRHNKNILYNNRVITSQNFKNVKQNGFKDKIFPSFDNIDQPNNSIINFCKNNYQFEKDNKSNNINNILIKILDLNKSLIFLKYKKWTKIKMLK